MFHRVKSVVPEKNFMLLVQFSEGITKQYDVSKLFEKWTAFQALKNTPGLFSCVHVDAGGYGISWNDDVDLECEELWDNGKTVATPFDNLLSFRDATDLWNLNESTLRKAIQYGKLVNGVDVQKFGKQWIITRSAMQREYGEPKK
jgi:hypothetical protein